MKIAIVDDDLNFAEKIGGVINEFFCAQQENCETIFFSNGLSLLNELEENRNYDLYFCDVEMPAIDGLTLAQKIKRMDANSFVVFVTSYEKYAVPSYKLRANYYILKDEYKTELNQILEHIWEEMQYDHLQNQKEYYVIRNDVRTHRIRFDDIMYLTKDKKYTIFHCKKDDYRERASLESVCQILPEDRFIFVDRGCVVNLKYVSELFGLEITLIDRDKDIVLPVSRRMNAEVKEKLARYWGVL